MSKKESQVMTEHETLKFIADLLERYKKVEFQLKNEYENLMKVKNKFPKKYIDSKEIDYENHMIEAAGAKHESIVVARRFAGFASELKIELEYFEALFKIELADSALALKFEKITEGLRDAYVLTKKEIKELKLLSSNVESFSKSADKLVKAFESDEINFRRLADKHNKMQGFQ